MTFEGHEIGQAGFAPYGLGERSQASLWWVWDTHQLNPGSYNLEFTLLPDNIADTETFRLRPANQVPPPEPGQLGSQPPPYVVSSTISTARLQHATSPA